MKRLILLCIIASLLVMPAFAALTASGITTTAASLSGTTVTGGNTTYTHINPVAICAAYGKAPLGGAETLVYYHYQSAYPTISGDSNQTLYWDSAFTYPGSRVLDSTTLYPRIKYFAQGARCSDGQFYGSVVYPYYNSSAYTPPSLTVDFSCGGVNEANPYVPTPFDMVCVDNSTSSHTITAQNWTLIYPDLATYKTSNSTLVRNLVAEGWYGVQYSACNTGGLCGYANSTNYVNVTSAYIPETGISFWVHTYDPITGAKIGPSDIGIGNVTSGGWRNSSTNLGTAKFDSTDYARLEKLTVGQNVNLCGEAPGYKETCTNVSIAYDGWEYILNLVPTSLVPTGGRSTMIVNVINSNTAATISGATITISNSSVPYSSSKLSDANGIATFSNITAAGSYQITASKTGYVGATKYWPVYPDTVSNAYIGMLPVGATPVPTSTGGDPIYITPTQTTTYGPGETPDTRTDEEKDEDMMNLLRDQGPMLIQFFITCFVIYMIMGIGRGR